MAFGMSHLFESPIDKAERQIAHEPFEILQAAEDHGVDSVWPAGRRRVRQAPPDDLG